MRGFTKIAVIAGVLLAGGMVSAAWAGGGHYPPGPYHHRGYDDWHRGHHDRYLDYDRDCDRGYRAYYGGSYGFYLGRPGVSVYIGPSPVVPRYGYPAVVRPYPGCRRW